MNELYEHVKHNRGVGHTRLLMDGAINAQYPFFVVGSDQQHAKQLIIDSGNNKFAIPVSMQERNKFRGYDHPILIDNFVFTLTCESYMREIRALNDILDKKEADILRYNKIIEKTKQLPLYIRLFKPLFTKIINRYTNE